MIEQIFVGERVSRRSNFSWRIVCFGIVFHSWFLTTAHAQNTTSQWWHPNSLPILAGSNVELSDSNVGWVSVRPNERLTSPRGNPVRPREANVLNRFDGVIFADMAGRTVQDVLNYKVQFFQPGEYSVFVHYSLFDMIGETNYDDEDSIIIPRSFGGQPGIADVVTLPKRGQNSSLESPHFWEGQFYWSENLEYADGSPVRYVVTDEQFAQELDFQIAYSEPGVAIDAILFLKDLDEAVQDAAEFDFLDEFLSQFYAPGAPADFSVFIDPLQTSMRTGRFDPRVDLNGDNKVDILDHEEARQNAGTFGPEGHVGVWLGDANIDGEFNSSDLVMVFGNGEFEDNDSEKPETITNSTWFEGDWNADGEFDTSDFVVAFQEGGYENGPRRPRELLEVPEPFTCWPIFIAVLIRFRWAKQNQQFNIGGDTE